MNKFMLVCVMYATSFPTDGTDVNMIAADDQWHIIYNVLILLDIVE